MNLPVTVVVPTVGRPSLRVLLGRLAAARGPRPEAIVVVDDRRDARDSLEVPGEVGGEATVHRTGGRGPAAARTAGWRLARTPWVAFLDDDVVPEGDWLAALEADLAELPDDVAGSQGRVRVPLPQDRRPTDWERNTAGLATARWITADMAYRRAALSEVGGFDERFRRAYREDADLALRVLATGARLVTGSRRVTHPVRPADGWVSVRMQAGNADDVLMRRLHGRDWRARAGAAPGRRSRHLATSASGVAALGLAATGHRRSAAAAALTWAAGTGEFAAARLGPGPRDATEVRRMLLTSVAIPPVAAWHTLRGLARHRQVARWRGVPELVLFDRDGTLVHDVPYNGDPQRVRPVPGAREALLRLRAAGIRTGVVSNQSGVARGLVTPGQVAEVNARVEALLGPFDTWQVCPHGPGDGCACRKPAPGLVKQACADVGVDPARAALVGDIGTDVEAALAAGARPVLVPTPATRTEEVAAAPCVAADLTAAVRVLLAGAG